MNNMHLGLFGVLGMLCGMLLYLLPLRLFYRHTTWLTEEEFLAAFPEKRWVTRVMYGLLPLGFILFVLLITSTDNKEIIFIFFFPIFFCCVGALPAVPELLARASVLIPVGHGARAPSPFTCSPNAVWAGIFRLATAALVVGVFLWCR